jgi:hypothetical protein
MSSYVFEADFNSYISNCITELHKVAEFMNLFIALIKYDLGNIKIKSTFRKSYDILFLNLDKKFTIATHILR